jgi:hypothetical protein
MKPMTRITYVLFFLVIALLAFTGQVFADDGVDGDQVIFGRSYRLESDEVLRGSLVIFGGSGLLEEDSLVEGDIFISGGALRIYGQVDGNVTSIGGSVYLADSAEIFGDVVALASGLTRSDGAVVRGDLIGSMPTDWGIEIPETPAFNKPIFRPMVWNWFDFNPMQTIPTGMLDALVWAALGLLVVLVLPEPANRVTRAIAAKPINAAGMGLLTAAVLIVATLTLILIPVVLILLPFLVLGWAFGIISLGYLVGQRLEELLKTRWAPPVSAGLGILSMLVVVNMVDWIPCVGWLLNFVLAAIGIGAVVVTRFGSREYPGSDLSVPQMTDPSGPVIVPGSVVASQNDLTAREVEAESEIPAEAQEVIVVMPEDELEAPDASIDTPDDQGEAPAESVEQPAPEKKPAAKRRSTRKKPPVEEKTSQADSEKPDEAPPAEKKPARRTSRRTTRKSSTAEDKPESEA